MENGRIASRILKFLGGLRLERLADVGREPTNLGVLDGGILKVAMLVSALDGHVADNELQNFEKLAKKCRGYNAESARKVFREGLRAAGYVELAARTLNAKELLDAFMEEAGRALPDGFACGDARDVRRAFVMWTAMAMSDADYSRIERRAIAMLADKVRGQIMGRRAGNDRLQRLSPAFAAAYRETGDDAEVFPADFFAKIEELVAKLDCEDSAPAAMAGLKSLIANS